MKNFRVLFLAVVLVSFSAVSHADVASDYISGKTLSQIFTHNLGTCQDSTAVAQAIQTLVQLGANPSDVISAAVAGGCNIDSAVAAAIHAGATPAQVATGLSNANVPASTISSSLGNAGVNSTVIAATLASLGGDVLGYSGGAGGSDGSGNGTGFGSGLGTSTFGGDSGNFISPGGVGGGGSRTISPTH
jgi:hypothetical protein